MESQAENSHMEYILANPGLGLIADKIISYLDLPDLKQCQQVSQDFKYIITENSLKKIRMLKKNLSSILSKNKRSNFSAWDQFLETFNEDTKLEELKLVANFLERYSKKKNKEKSPFFLAILGGKTDFIKLIMKSPNTSDIVREVPKGVKYGRPTLCFNITDATQTITLPEWFLFKLDGGPERQASIKFVVDKEDDVRAPQIEMTYVVSLLEDAPMRAIGRKNTFRMSTGTDGIDIYAIPGFGNQVFIGPFNKPYKMVGFDSKSHFD